MGSQPTKDVWLLTCYIEGVWFYCICVQVYDRSKLYYSCRFMQDNMAQMIATLDLQDLLKNGIRRSTSSPALAARKAANDLLECVREDSNAGRLELFSLSVVQLLDKATHKLAMRKCGTCSTVFKHPMNTNTSVRNFWKNRW